MEKIVGHLQNHDTGNLDEPADFDARVLQML
jgi:hypothetical protein